MKFFEDVQPRGHLEVWKHYPDGTKELHFSDDNVICSGMGATLSEMMDANPDNPIQLYQIAYFKVGTSGTPKTTEADLQVSTTGDVSGPLTQAMYGDQGNLNISIHNLMKNGAVDSTAGGATTYGVIPTGYIKRVTETKCMFQIVLDEQTANVGDESTARYLDEIGIYSRNPFQKDPEASLLCAYRYFKPVYKTDAFILVFRWVIEF